MSQELLQDLHDLINRRQLCVIVGTGVSVATTENAPTASWVGLLKSGLQRCQIVGKTQKWIERESERLDEAIEESSLTDLLSVADLLGKHLQANSPGEYARWLEEAVGPDVLPVKDDSLIQAIDALDAIILTTNYDDLIERVTGRGAAH